MRTRPYKVTNRATKQIRLIEGTNVAQVARFVIGSDYEITPCNGMDAVRLIADEGVKLESAMTAPKTVVV